MELTKTVRRVPSRWMCGFSQFAIAVFTCARGARHCPSSKLLRIVGEEGSLTVASPLRLLCEFGFDNDCVGVRSLVPLSELAVGGDGSPSGGGTRPVELCAGG